MLHIVSRTRRTNTSRACACVYTCRNADGSRGRRSHRAGTLKFAICLRGVCGDDCACETQPRSGARVRLLSDLHLLPSVLVAPAYESGGKRRGERPRCRRCSQRSCTVQKYMTRFFQQGKGACGRYDLSTRPRNVLFLLFRPLGSVVWPTRLVTHSRASELDGNRRSISVRPNSYGV